jgi:hypothetical protein
MADTAALIAKLPEKEKRGSRPRCLLLTEGVDTVVAARLNEMLEDPRAHERHAVVDPAQHRWGPSGFADRDEHQLHRSALLPPAACKTLSGWWFAKQSGVARSPTWDLVAQARIGGRDGLVLVEAKAHENELSEAGKRETEHSNMDNHARIGEAIEDARAELEMLRPGWKISAGSHYQLANRFAWAWRLASSGVPVVLVYLGFTGAEEMKKDGAPIRDDEHWSDVIDNYSRGLVPADIWDKQLDVGGTPLIALKRTLAISLKGRIAGTAPAI